MLIWLALLIPLSAAIILAVFFTRKMVWWEYLLVVGIPVIVIVAGKILSVQSQIMATEYWNSYVIRAEYEEEWDEWVHETCFRTVSCGKNCTTQVPYDCSHRVYHPPEWTIFDNIGESFSVSQEFYNQIKQIWHNETFKAMHRSFYTIDGNAYFSIIKDSLGLSGVVPICRPHVYTNRVKAARSVFNFEKVDSVSKATYKLFDYPKNVDKFNFPALMGFNDQKAYVKLQRYNAILGHSKEVHMMILVFTDQSREAGQLQEAYWKGSNKNEFILCIGQSKNRIKWTKVISWTDAEKLKVTVARKVREMDTLNLEAIVDYMQGDVKQSFVRKNWHDFDYLTVEPTFTAIIITFIITLLVTVGISIVVVKDDINL